MNSTVAGKNIPAKNTPSWLKWTLLVLLFTSAIAGFAFRALMIRRSAARFSASCNRKTDSAPESSKFSNFQAMLKKSEPVNAITCQGLLKDKEGVAMAFIDGQIVATGETIGDMRILEITASNILVECRGKTCRLSPGETFTPEKL